MTSTDSRIWMPKLSYYLHVPYRLSSCTADNEGEGGEGEGRGGEGGEGRVRGEGVGEQILEYHPQHSFSGCLATTNTQACLSKIYTF